MTPEIFNKFMDHVIEHNILGVMCKKSAEYARENDKLYNFYRAAEIDRISPIEALRGMHLKHRTSILDMLDDLDMDIEHPQDMWEEKLQDTINYYFLLWALLTERYGWEVI